MSREPWTLLVLYFCYNAVRTSCYSTTKILHYYKVFFEAQTGFEPVMTVLQTDALPLGYWAVFKSSIYILQNSGLNYKNKK